MAQSKLQNQITIKIYEDKGSIVFKSEPSVFQLMAAKIILEELIDFHFTAQEEAIRVYKQIHNVEEVHKDV